MDQIIRESTSEQAQLPGETSVIEFLTPVLGFKLAWNFRRAGISDINALSKCSKADLLTFGGVGEKRAQDIQSAVHEWRTNIGLSAKNVVQVDFRQQKRCRLQP